MRLFVAVWPDEATRERLSAMDLPGHNGVRLVRPEQWHITLRFLGEVEDPILPSLLRSLREEIRIMSGPARCEMGPATRWFDRGRVLQIPVSGLEALAGAVGTATSSVLPRSGSGVLSFVGHLTLARAKGRLDAAGSDALAGIPFESTFSIPHVDLVRSVLSHEGPSYTTLERLPTG
jgi:RNA 2',3'-cyclic 3'-phosphodiesterase